MAQEPANAYLEGGPADWPEQDRAVVAEPGPEPTGKITVPRGNGYEHFTATGETREVAGRRLAVHRWEYSTKIAE